MRDLNEFMSVRENLAGLLQVSTSAEWDKYMRPMLVFSLEESRNKLERCMPEELKGFQDRTRTFRKMLDLPDDMRMLIERMDQKQKQPEG